MKVDVRVTEDLVKVTLTKSDGEWSETWKYKGVAMECEKLINEQVEIPEELSVAIDCVAQSATLLSELVGDLDEEGYR